MIQESVSIDETIDFLNSLLEIDQAAISALICKRVECTPDLADHPTVQVRQEQDLTLKVGLLGILNGLFGVDASHYGPIAVNVENGVVLEFVRWTK